MLLGIPEELDGDLLKILCDMGHGDEIVVADANFPAERCGMRVVKSMASSGVGMVGAILRVMPLDHLGGEPACLMAVAEGDDCGEPAIWGSYSELILPEKRFEEKFSMLERGEFYERAERSFAVVQTGEGALYANVILRKGVVRP